MKNIIKEIINEITKEENFDLKTYYTYIEKYGNEMVLQAFYQMIQDPETIESALEKYFDAYFTIELESMEINDRTYIKLANKYGEDKINNYFDTLLKVHNNPKQIKERYSPIYFYIETIKNSQQAETFELTDTKTDDSVKLYLKEIGEYPLLPAAEERRLLNILNDARNNINIATYDELDNFQITDINKLINSIKTKEQFKKLITISKYLSEETELDKNNKKALNTYIDAMRNYFKNHDEIILSEKNKYKEKYINQQLTLMKDFIKSRETLIQANLRLVVSIAKHYSSWSIGLLDSIQEGNIGLMKAIKKFDCTKSTKLSTYATWWIRQAVTRYTADNCRTIRIPVHCNEKINKYTQALRRLTLEIGPNPPIELLSKETGYNEEEIEEIQKLIYNNTYVSLDGHINDEDDSEIIDFIADTFDIEAEVSKKMLSKVFEELLDTLPQREREVIKHRYGFYNGKIYTLEEVGQIYGVTRERIRQIENKTLRKLRHSSRSKKIRDFA